MDHDDHHHHGEFIAHHFDSAEQQFDSGKLGIWLFLVTEVLFFSGLFVAYTLYRNHHPEIFEQAHVFLDKYLGGLNTVVLLFSSLTMALAVRSAQLGKNKNCSVYILITMVCAAVFLGVKAVEYSHKWDMGIFVRSGFDLSYDHPEPQTKIGQALHISDYLVYLSAVPTLLLGLFLGGSLISTVTGKSHLSKFLLGLAVMVGGYFLGAVGGQIYVKAKDSADSHASATLEQQPLVLQAMMQEPDTAEGADTDKTAQDDHSGDDQNHDLDDHGSDDQPHEDGSHAEGADHDHEGHAPHEYNAHHPDPATLSPDVGIFFSIYYCMTGLHAIHIIAGIIALAWIYWRCILGHWREDYFGPVDYVGLYWHLVDLIWIYLFPLLYLID